MKFLLQKAKTIGDAQLALTPVSKSFGAVSTEYENVNIAVLYFKTFQLTGIMEKQISEYLRELEEINLAIQSANPKLLFDAADKKKLLELIGKLQEYESKQINNR